MCTLRNATCVSLKSGSCRTSLLPRARKMEGPWLFLDRIKIQSETRRRATLKRLEKLGKCL